MPRVVMLVSWMYAPEWLSLAEASHLSGYDADMLLWLIHNGGVDAREDGHTWKISKASLQEYQETLLAGLYPFVFDPHIWV